MFAIQKGKEAIHSGHFMVSHFEAEEQDDEDELAVPIPEVTEVKDTLVVVEKPLLYVGVKDSLRIRSSQQQLAIDTSLAKLFQCMSLAYRQKLTSPKWNRFRGIRLTWKDKIRLNNVIWRCWHMQFIKKKNTLICQFASPLDVDTHNKPEAVVLEGKYWKRKLAAVTAEYKKWRMFYRNHALGHFMKDTPDMLNDMDMLTWTSQSSEDMHMMVDEDYMGLMSDTLFSTITNQPFVFPDSREIAKAGLADFIQPSLGPLQPNLDDYMDTFEPLQEFMSGKLPTVPEEHGHDYKPLGWSYYPELDLMPANPNGQNTQIMEPFQQESSVHPEIIEQKPPPVQDTRQLMNFTGNVMIQQPVEAFVEPRQPPSYQSSVISKTTKHLKAMPATHGKINAAHSQTAMYSKPLENVYQGYTSISDMNTGIFGVEERLQIQDQQVAAQAQAQVQEAQNFKVPQSTETTQASRGYKFSAPSLPVMPKFTTQKEEVMERRMRGTDRERQRSRSTTREPLKRPPLLSAVSDPQLVTPNNSVLLTQLLTNSSENNTNLFARNQSVGLVHDQRQKQRAVKEENSPIQILPQPTATTTTLIITTPVMNTMQSSLNDPLLLNSLSNSNSPVLDTNSQGLNSPTSSQGSLGSPNRDAPHRDQRRVGHIHAEQKRRYNIKNGFDMIHSLIPHLYQNPNAKLSKAAMLQKGAEYIIQLRAERNQLKEEMDSLRQQIETLNTSISNCQSLLPATGAPVSRRRDSKMQEMFDEYVRTRTMDNWKFWIFSLLFKPLLTSFNNSVSTSSLADLYRSTMLWVEQHCPLGDLRPVALNSFRYLCTKTDILSEPEKLPEEARKAVAATSKEH